MKKIFVMLLTFVLSAGPAFFLSACSDDSGKSSLSGDTDGSRWGTARWGQGRWNE